MLESTPFIAEAKALKSAMDLSTVYPGISVTPLFTDP